MLCRFHACILGCDTSHFRPPRDHLASNSLAPHPTNYLTCREFGAEIDALNFDTFHFWKLFFLKTLVLLAEIVRDLLLCFTPQYHLPKRHRDIWLEHQIQSVGFEAATCGFDLGLVDDAFEVHRLNVRVE